MLAYLGASLGAATVWVRRYAPESSHGLEVHVPVARVFHAYTSAQSSLQAWLQATPTAGLGAVLTSVASAATCGLVSAGETSSWRRRGDSSTFTLSETAINVAIDTARGECLVGGGALRPVPDVIAQHADFLRLFASGSGGTQQPCFCAEVPVRQRRWAFQFTRDGVR